MDKKKGNDSSIFSRNSEANTSELLEHIEEIITRISNGLLYLLYR